MGQVIILEETTRDPITLMGSRAGICWGSDVTDRDKNYKRGLDCLISGHGRVMEYVNVEMVLDGYSARVIREWYTHLGGSPTRLQASTRYVDYDHFAYVIPPAVKRHEEACRRYQQMMDQIREVSGTILRGKKGRCCDASSAWNGNKDCGQTQFEELDGYEPPADVQPGLS